MIYIPRLGGGLSHFRLDSGGGGGGEENKRPLIWGGVGGGWTHPQYFLSGTRLEIEIADFYRLLFEPFF